MWQWQPAFLIYTLYLPVTAGGSSGRRRGGTRSRGPGPGPNMALTFWPTQNWTITDHVANTSIALNSTLSLPLLEAISPIRYILYSGLSCQMVRSMNTSHVRATSTWIFTSYAGQRFVLLLCHFYGGGCELGFALWP